MSGPLSPPPSHLPRAPPPPPPPGTAGFSGGAIATAVAGEVRLDNVTVTDNYSSSHSGAFLVWGSTFVVTDSRIERVSVAALSGQGRRGCRRRRRWRGWPLGGAGRRTPAPRPHRPVPSPAYCMCIARPCNPRRAEHGGAVWRRGAGPAGAVQRHPHLHLPQPSRVRRGRRREADVGRRPVQGLPPGGQPGRVRRRARGAALRLAGRRLRAAVGRGRPASALRRAAPPLCPIRACVPLSGGACCDSLVCHPFLPCPALPARPARPARS